jgi:small-conductance mechanosensitive channel
MEIKDFSLQMGELLTPFISMMTIVIIGLLIKDLASDIANGISFKYFGPFKEGDKVILDGHKAVIVKIGLTVSVFGCDDPERGYIWRYIPNDKIGSLTLGKVITSSTKKL